MVRTAYAMWRKHPFYELGAARIFAGCATEKQRTQSLSQGKDSISRPMRQICVLITSVAWPDQAECEAGGTSPNVAVNAAYMRAGARSPALGRALELHQTCSGTSVCPCALLAEADGVY